MNNYTEFAYLLHITQHMCRKLCYYNFQCYLLRVLCIPTKIIYNICTHRERKTENVERLTDKLTQQLESLPF